MIRNDEELHTAQEGVTNLERVLVEARRTHTAEQYKALAAPMLLELQQRQQEILVYLLDADGSLDAANDRS